MLAASAQPGVLDRFTEWKDTFSCKVSCGRMQPPLRRVTLALKPVDYTMVRFAFSPLWECVAGFRAWKDPSRHALLLPWLTRIKSALSGVDWTPLMALALVPRGMIPDFLVPPPATPSPKFTEELETLRNVPESVLRAEVKIAYPQGVPDELKSLLRQPSTLLNTVALLLSEFWRRAIAPDWGLIQSRLESEILFRARALALGGFEGVFHDLHRYVHYKQGRLSIETISYWDGKLRKPGMLLLPSVFAWPDAFLTVRPPWQPTIVYPARGIAELWSKSEIPSPKGLSRVLGSPRAKILTRLQEPKTTKQLACALLMSPASVSEQIMKLWQAGMLDRTRIGRNVFYVLSERGKTIFTLLEREHR
jgi:DNA-binding transcriptional ArsR family regulator